MDAGWDLFTLEGEINNAAHWNKNAATALQTKNYKDLYKNLKRTQDNLKKAKSMAGLKGTGDDLTDDVIKAIDQLVGNDPDFFNKPENTAKIKAFFEDTKNLEKVDDFIKNAKGELGLLEKIEKSVDSKEVKAFAEMMDDQGFMKNVRKFFKSDAFQYGLDGIFYAMMAVDAYNLYKTDGNLGLARAIARNSNLTTLLTDAGLEAVTDGILESAAGVDCADVAAGAFTTYGYQNVGEGLDLKKLAARLPEYADLPEGRGEALVQESDQIFNSQIKPEIEKYIRGNLIKGSVATPLDTRLADKVIGRCLPYFKNELAKMRKETIENKKDLLAKLREEIKKIAITGLKSSPDKPRAASKVTLEMTFNQSPEKSLKDAEEELKKQGAANPSLIITYAWKISTLEGTPASIPKEESSLTNLVTFTPEKAATYQLQATVTIDSVMDIFTRWGKIKESVNKDFTLKILPAEVEVPDLIGLDEEAAKTKLREAGLELEKEISKTFAKGKEPERILEQDPKSKTKIDAGSKVKALFNLSKNPTQIFLITKTPVVLKPGETQDVSVEVAYSSGEKEKPKKELTTWTSSQATVAVVDDQAGRIKALSAGKAELTVEFEKMKAQINVEVADWDRDVEFTVFKTDWQGNQTTSTVSNASVQAALKKGTTGMDGKVLLTRFGPGSYEALAEASGYKKAPPKAFTLTAARDENEAKTPVKLSLYIQEERNLEELKISPYQFNATDTGDRRQLTATITYSNGDEEEVTGKVKWESDNPKAAQVSSTGEVTIPNSADSGDQAVIKAVYTFQGTTKTGTCTISMVIQSDVDFTVTPSPPRSSEASTFSVNLTGSKNVRSGDTFRWKVRKFGETRQEDMGTGTTISYAFSEQARYAVELTVLNSKGDQKAKREKDFTAEASIKAISGTANEWKGTLQGKTLVVTSHPWNGQTRQFSPDPDFSTTLSNVQFYDVRTGSIKGAFNPGYVAYVSGECVRFFIKATSVKSVMPSSVSLSPNLEFNQSIGTSCNDVASNPQLTISEVREYGFVVSWINRKGGSCTAAVKLYTGELEGPVFCSGGKELAVPALLLSPPAIDADTEVKVAVTNAGENPGCTYTWLVDGKSEAGPGGSTTFSGKFTSGSHTIKVLAENAFGAKKESYPLSFSVKPSAKKPAAGTPEAKTPPASSGTPKEDPKVQPLAASTAATMSVPKAPVGEQSLSVTIAPPPSLPKSPASGAPPQTAVQPIPTPVQPATGMTKPKPYDPREDPNLQEWGKPVDTGKTKEMGSGFQAQQWKILDAKTLAVKEQPPGQPQSQYYPSVVSTTAATTIPPGGALLPSTVPPVNTVPPTTVQPSTTKQPVVTVFPATVKPSTAKPSTTTARATTTAPPSTAKPSTTATTGSAKNLTDVTVNRRDVTVTFWDHGVEDGDIINIYLNGKVLQKNILLKNKKQTFRVQLSGGRNLFEVEAVNEGAMPPNTATVEISNVTKGQPTQIYERKTGQRASMNLIAP